MIRVLLFTSQDISIEIIDFLKNSEEFDLIGVVAQQTTRDRIYGYRDPITHSNSLGLEVYVPDRLDGDFISLVRDLAPELMVNAYYPKIMPEQLFAIAPLGCVNVHPGMLPRYRGSFPTPWHILNGEQEIGITVHLIDEDIDTGPILLQKSFPIENEENGFALYRRSMVLSAEMLKKALPKYVLGELDPRPQKGEGTYYGHIDPQYHINWDQPVEIILRNLRVHAPPYFPGFGFLINKMVLINRASKWEREEKRAELPGVIIQVFEGGKFAVSCGDGVVIIEDFQLVPQVYDDDFETHIVEGHRFA